MATTTEQNYPTSFNRELVLDLTLQAFYVYNLEHLEDVDAPRVHDYIPISKSVKEQVLVDVLDSSGIVVTDSGGAAVQVGAVITSNRTRESREHTFKYLVTQGTKITIAEYRDFDFLDWVSYDSTGFDAPAFLFTGYDLSGDLMRKKQATYIIVHCKRTESLYGLVGSSVELLRQSSCLLQAQWGFNDSIVQGKWGIQFEAYRLFLPQPLNPASGDVFDYGPKVITTKNKLRGSGDALSLYFQSAAGKDMQILGWGILGTKVDEP